MRRSLGRCRVPGPLYRCCGCHRRPVPPVAIYAHAGTAVAFIISELPGERAEALFIAMAALVPTAGKQFTNRQGLMLRVARDQRVRHIG
jgi:hypothetical protein